MLLCVDIGNTTMGMGLFIERAGNAKLFVRKSPSHPVKSEESLRKTVCSFIRERNRVAGPADKLHAILSSVVPSLTRSVQRVLTDICGEKPLVVGRRLKSGLVFGVSHPEKVGADRIANAVAGFHRCNKPVAVADIGTATTITVVGRKKELLGGAILPGLELMLEALHSRAAKLPAASLFVPGEVIGKNTISAMASGVMYGTAGAIETLMENMEKELGHKLDLILTGGNAKLVSSLIRRNHLLVPDLTFEGLRLLYHMNRQ